MDKNYHKAALARFIAILLFFHIWLATAFLWYQLWQFGFFGEGMVGWIVAGVTFIVLATPVLTLPIINFAISPFIQWLLDKEIINNGGAISAIVTLISCFLYTIWGLSRDAWMAMWVFLLSPLIALVIALIATYVIPLLKHIRCPWR
jgi:hypothetical protein